jgi:menaquinone-dependent protoporphyrinogen oxidase
MTAQASHATVARGFNMRARILVFYGTTNGQARKVARAVAETFRAEGAAVDLVDAASRTDPAPELYTACVVTASVHIGGFQRSVRRWVKAHASALNVAPTAFVAVCLGVLEHNPKTDRDLDAIVERFFSRTGWRPSVRKIVAGALAYTQYNWLKRWAIQRIARKAGGATDATRDWEYTDWKDVKQFARGFHASVSASPIVHADTEVFARTTEVLVARRSVA